jgi:hypothetical protein
MFCEGAITRMQMISKKDSWGGCGVWSVEWLPAACEQGALQQAGWPKFSGRVEDFSEFKDKWHKIFKTGHCNKALLRALWEHFLQFAIDGKNNSKSKV